MISTFTNATTRSASDLLADLQACRQLRHVTSDQLRSVVRFFFGDIENGLLEKTVLPGTGGRYFVWEQEAFEEAVSIHGYSCDVCGEIEQVSEHYWRIAAERMLQNLDGQVRLCLCRVCSSRFSTFCTKHFQREVRALWTRELEQMMLAFIANELGREARRVLAGNPPRKRKNECVASKQDRNDRSSIEIGSDGAGNLSLDWHQPQHRAAIQEGIRR